MEVQVWVGSVAMPLVRGMVTGVVGGRRARRGRGRGRWWLVGGGGGALGWGAGGR